MYSKDDFISLDDPSIDWDEILYQTVDQGNGSRASNAKTNTSLSRSQSETTPSATATVCDTDREIPGSSDSRSKLTKTSRITKENIAKEYGQMIQTLQKELSEDPVLKLSSTGVKIVEVLSSIDQQEVPDFMIEMLHSSLTAGDKKRLPSAQREEMWRHFSVQRVDPVFLNNGIAYLEKYYQCQEKLTLRRAFSTFVSAIFDKFIMQSNKTHCDPAINDIALTSKEIEVLYYIGGSICSKLFKQCKKRGQTPLCELFQHLCYDDPSEVDPELPSGWTVESDRGGLTYVKPEMLSLLKKMDFTIQKYFNERQLVEYHSGDIRGAVFDEISGGDCITHWDNLLTDTDFSDDVKVKCFNMVVTLYLTIRGHAFCKRLIEQTNVEKSQKALRKSLKE